MSQDGPSDGADDYERFELPFDYSRLSDASHLTPAELRQMSEAIGLAPLYLQAYLESERRIKSRRLMIRGSTAKRIFLEEHHRRGLDCPEDVAAATAAIIKNPYTAPFSRAVRKLRRRAERDAIEAEAQRASMQASCSEQGSD